MKKTNNCKSPGSCLTNRKNFKKVNNHSAYNDHRMKGIRNFLFLLVSFFVTSSFCFKSDIVIDKNEAKNAYQFLQEIRANPARFHKELQLEKDIKVSPVKLVWNDTLARVAAEKAYDMAKRDYFDHVDPEGFGINYHINKSGYTLNPDWVKNKADNAFESITSNYFTGKEAIKALIIDEGVPSLGHRIHLLGLNTWNASLKDIGIGFVKRESGSKYQTYVCVIIAKHNW